MRSLLRTKALAVTVVGILALAIGANAAMFSVLRGVLLRPLENRSHERSSAMHSRAAWLASSPTWTTTTWYRERP